MDGRGGCCLVRYAGEADVVSKVELIMLRYRPIAPKPGVLPPSASPATEPGEPTGKAKVGGAAARRKGRREGAGRRGRKRRAPHPAEVAVQERVPRPAGDLVTLPLLPETPVAAAAASPPGPDLARSQPVSGGLYVGEGPGKVVAPVGSWVTLECVTETCEVVVEGRYNWLEVKAALEGDACPAFLSDATDRVAWTNAEYWRMVGWGEAGEAGVVLATGGRVPSGTACGGFSCRVSVRCARRRGEKASWSLVVPCDVWRLAEDGWLAWRLDVKAALCLGR